MPRILVGLLLLFATAAATTTPAQSQTVSWSSFDAAVGSGLQSSSINAVLSTGAHGGVTVHIETADTALVLLTDDELSPGGNSVDIFLPNGSTTATFYIQALEDTTGVAHVTATATGFSAALDSIDVVQPSLKINSLNASHDPFDVDDTFTIIVGVANGSNTNVAPAQKVRVGGPGLTATITNSNALVGQLVTTALTAQVVTATIAPGENSSPTTVATGGVAFDGLAAGTTDVEATIPGFNPLVNGNPQTLTVDAPEVTMYTFPTNVGSGLQEGSNRVRLSGSQHGGVTVHIESGDSNMVLLALGRYDAGTPSLDVFVPNGSIDALFYVQALEDTAGVVAISASAPGFAIGVSTVNVLQPYFRLSGLGSTIDTLDPNDTFWISIGLPNGTFTNISPSQQARGGGPGFTFTVTSSVDSVGLLETSSTLNDTAIVYIAPGQPNAPTTVGTGGVAFDGVGEGVTTVTASANDMIPVSTGTVNVTVTQPVLTIGNKPSIGVGSGLRTSGTMRTTLSASQHGGVTVHVEVADTNLALISESGSGVGQKSLDIFLANGITFASYYVHGKEDTTGTVVITGTAPGFITGVDSIQVVVPKVRITNSITGTQDTLDPPDDFATSVGVANTVNFFTQPVRPGSPGGVVMTATVDDSLVAELLTLADTSHTVSVTIPAGESTSPNNVASGGFAFNGLSPGVVELSVTAPGFEQFSAAFRTITVTSPTSNMSAPANIAAGLQAGAYSLTLSASGHGGVTAHIECLEPELVLVSDGVSNPGQPFIDVFIPDGSTSTTFYFHGMDDTTGTATVVATVPAFIGDIDSINVVTPGVEITQLSGSIDAADPVDQFYTRVGVPSGTNATLSYTLNRRAGAPPLTVTLISSNGGVAELVKTATADDTVTVQILAGQDNSPTTVATGGAALDGLASGQTVVSASIPGFITVGTGQKVVDVSNQNIYVNGLATRLGKDLQSVAASAELGEPNHGGITVHIEVSDSTLGLISANALVAGARFIDVTLPNGDAEALFYLQALDTGQVTVTATASTFAAAMQVVDLVPAGVRIVGLADTLAITDPDDEFIAQVGAVNGDNSDIEEPQALRGGGPPRTLSIASSDGDLAFIVLGNTLGATRGYVIDPGEFETPVSVATGGLALTPWNVGTVTVTASTPDFVTTTAGMPVVVLMGTPTGVDDRTPLVFGLDQNVPNPFNPVTTINFSLPAAAAAELVVYDVAGRRVVTLLNQDMPAGRASVQWQGLDDRGNQVASGVYFYRLRAGSKVETRKMVLLK